MRIKPPSHSEPYAKKSLANLALCLIFVMIVFHSSLSLGQRCGVGSAAHAHTKSFPLHKSGLDSTTVWRLPVVFHVIHKGEGVGMGTNISDQRILDQITIMNNDFRRKAGTPGFNFNPVGRDTKIEFALANLDPNGNPTTGITRTQGSNAGYTIGAQKVLSALAYWPANEYINIWVCEINNGFFGFSSFPESTLPGLSSLPQDSLEDGLMLNYEHCGINPAAGAFGLGRTATHEMGHYLGLIHIWGDAFSCVLDDYCDDTPFASSPTFGCPSNKNTCTSPGNDMVANYLDYSDDACMNVFTRDQMMRMRYILTNSPRRKSLVNSTNLSPKPLMSQSPSLKIYPNPSSEILTIELTGINTSAIEIKISDYCGKEIAHQKVDQRTTFSIVHWPPGMYWVHVHTQQEVFVRSFVVR